VNDGYANASVIVPVYKQADFIEGVIRTYHASLQKLPVPFELILVPNGPDDGSAKLCRELERELAEVRVVESAPGWGRAVHAGIEAATGELICYTNSARTSGEALVLVLLYATTYPGVVIKASRKTRDNLRRRLGSLIYNLECRWLFDIASFDVNGTPKAFPRRFDALLHLQRRDDVIDAEFNAACRIHGYPMIEVPIVGVGRHGGRSTTNYRSALHMYYGAYQLWKSLRRLR
jgi:glycosyltransferase involved in cell wall biosynthesis